MNEQKARLNAIHLDDQSMVEIIDHPLVQHKITKLRDKNTGTKEFRDLVADIAALMAYEALRDLNTKDLEVETPICQTLSLVVAEEKLAAIQVLRAGQGMIAGILSIIPSAKVGTIGLYRDPSSHKPVEYYNNLPEPIEEMDIIVADPMLATGGSAIDAIDLIKKQGGKNLKFICIIAAPEGVKALSEAHPDVKIYIGHLDEKLNENAYIVPGLGDAGDRIFGTNSP